MPRSDTAEFRKLVRQVLKKKSVSRSALFLEANRRKKSRTRSRSSVVNSVKTSVRSKPQARSVKKGKKRRRKSSQQAGAVRDGSHQRFPRCR